MLRFPSLSEFYSCKEKSITCRSICRLASHCFRLLPSAQLLLKINHILHGIIVIRFTFLKTGLPVEMNGCL